MSTPAVRTSLVVAVITLALGTIPEFIGLPEPSISLHHVYHAVFLAGGVIAGLIAASGQARRSEGESPQWLLPMVLAPVIAMFLMWPSTYEFLEQRPPLHATEHVGFIALGFIAAFAGQRYTHGLGFATGIYTVLMALLSALGFGIMPRA